jgi:tRNA threonylcarbamoyladenosine biosynthesis protein TsaE
MIVSNAPDDTRALGAQLATLLEPSDVVLLAGPLGAGKTELVKGIASGLGVTDTVVSPTFTIAREYAGRLRLLHVDVYRLDTAQEVVDLGLEDLAADAGAGPDAVTVVEWGDAVAGLLPTDHLLVWIDLGEHEHTRHLRIEPSGASWARRRASLDALTGVDRSC